jgi:hypothetical protein
MAFELSKEPFKLQYEWSVVVDRNGRKTGKLLSTKCEDKDIPNEDHLGGSIANAFVQLTTNEQRLASLSVNTEQVIQQGLNRFVYMDAGCWLNAKQSFAIVHHDQAVLCAYSPSTRIKAIASGDLLADILALPGVEKLRQLTIFGPHDAEKSRLKIILPDCHIAASPIMTPRPHRELWWQNPKTFEFLSKRDLFQSRLSIPALIEFLRLIRQTPFARQIDLTQVGDLYELWMGRDCLFKRKSQGPPGVALTKPNADVEVADWICETHEIHEEVFEEFDLCKESLGSVNFLHGNHDSYLSVPDVVSSSNFLIGLRSGLIDPPHSFWCRPMRKSVVYPREASGCLSSDGVFIEHGQRCDQFNGDGIQDGHSKTQSAGGGFGTILMEFDSTRRPSFVTAAATLWLKSQKAFGCYVMGHTHRPELQYVEVTHKRSDRVVTDLGGTFVVET